MGSRDWLENERMKREAQEVARQAAAEVESARKALADKIVMVVVDQIVRDIIRPGPVAEERECYDMARELRDIGPTLTNLVSRVLKVSEDEDGDA